MKWWADWLADNPRDHAKCPGLTKIEQVHAGHRCGGVPGIGGMGCGAALIVAAKPTSGFLFVAREQSYPSAAVGIHSPLLEDLYGCSK